MNENILVLTNNTERLLKETDKKKRDFKNNEMDIVVKIDELNAGKEIFYAYRWGMYYDMTNEFKPQIAGAHAIPEDMQNEFYQLLPQARQALKQYKLNNASNNSEEKFELEKIIVSLRQKNDDYEQHIESQGAIIEGQKRTIERLEEAAKNVKNNSQLDEITALMLQAQNTLIQAQKSIPKTITIKVGENENKIEDKAMHHEFETILSYIANGVNVYMYGPAGTGKSTIGENVAKALGRKFTPESALREDIKITGYKDSNGVYHESTFYTAMKEGHLYMIDEIDNSHPDVLTVINTAIAQKYFIFPNGELVRAHKDFMIIVAGNTTGNGGDEQYIRNVIDAASSDRFIQLEINYDIKVEKQITGDNMELIEFAHEYRKAVELTEGVFSLCSYRALAHITKMEDKIELAKLMKHALIKGVAMDDMRMIIRNMSVDRNNKYFKALKEAANM
jgi:DNA polymerase III delta prime subunit